jgi:hypothetical protein
MKATFVRLAFAVILLAPTSACLSDTKEVGADKLDAVHEGMPKDSVMEIMGTGPLTASYADTLRVERGFRRSGYFIDGKNYEVLYYRELQGNVAEAVEQVKETPVVLVDGKVLGWGWAFYVEAMEKYKFPSPLAPITAPDSSAKP